MALCRSSGLEEGFCVSSQRSCTKRKLDGYEYCLKHILEDKNSLFRQCCFVSSKTGKRCMNAAPKAERKDGLCADHQAKAVGARQKEASGRKLSHTAANLLESLERYDPACGRVSNNGGGDAAAGTAKYARPAAATAKSRPDSLYEYSSSDETGSEELPVDEVYKGTPNSDNESIDSEGEDPFKYADVFTPEEVVRITRDKLVRLQSLYIEQFKRLQHVLTDRRRRFEAAAKLESTHGVLPQQLGAAAGAASAGSSKVESHQKYEQRKAARRYRKRFGVEALMHCKSKERRAAVRSGVSAVPAVPTAMQRCSAGAGRAGRCSGHVIPLSKYCLKHIANDPHQVLFKRCGFLGGKCERPMPALFANSRCDLHEGFSCQLGPAAVPLLRGQQAQHGGSDGDDRSASDLASEQFSPLDEHATRSEAIHAFNASLE